MSTLFTRIINGEIPGRFVWKDEEVVAFLTIAPITQGHTLVVPREEVDSWTHATPELLAKVMDVAQSIGKVQEGLFDAKRVGVLMEGLRWTTCMSTSGLRIPQQILRSTMSITTRTLR